MSQMLPFRRLQGPACQQDRLLMCLNLCQAVADLHARFVLHGDLRLANITVDPLECRMAVADAACTQNLEVHHAPPWWFP